MLQSSQLRFIILDYKGADLKDTEAKHLYPSFLELVSEEVVSL